MNRRNFLKKSMLVSLVAPLSLMFPKKSEPLFYIGNKDGCIKLDSSGFNVRASGGEVGSKNELLNKLRGK